MSFDKITCAAQTASCCPQPSAERGASGRKLPNTDAAQDAELVRRHKAGDENAFAEIMHRHREKLLGLCLALLRNHADAEDIVQDTFIRAHRGLRSFRGDSSLATWLRSIATNLARNRYWFYFRRRRHATFSLECPLAEGSDATIADLVATTDPDPARSASANEFSGLIGACMTRLPEPHREILTLRNLLHHSYEEIAATLGISVGTVKSRIARARENVRSLLAAMCPEFPPEAELRDWFESPPVGGRYSAAVA